MLKKITATTAVASLGLPPERKLHKVPTGPCVNRMIALFLTAPGTLQYSFADPPYTAWSTPATIASDVSDAPFDSVIDSGGNVHIFYTTTSNLFLVTRKLPIADSDWSIGSPVIVYNVNPTANPSCAIEESGTIWIAWSEVIGGSHTLCVKSSSDDGATWGSGPGDSGDVLTYGSVAVYPRLLAGSTHINLIYVDGISSLLFRSRPIGGSTWSSADTIGSGTTLDAHFDAALSPGGLLGVAYDQVGLRYRSFDGSVWSTVVTVDAASAFFPQLVFNNNVPYLFYLVQEATDQKCAKFATLNGDSFSTPEAIDSRASYLKAVVLFDSSDGSYSDQTANAASSDSADIFHPVSTRLIESAGDAVYLGGDQKFRYLSIHLSTTGSGGTLSYSYFDGVNWKSFTPAGGIYAFDSPDKSLLLWDDLNSIPSDWQKCTVDNDSRYWIRIEVISDFSTAPIGSQITAISNIQYLSVRR